MLYKVSSLVTAEAIVNIVVNNTDFQHVNGFIESFQNGREQGFLIYLSHDVTYFICEGRNSGLPVIFKGEYSMQGLSENAYRHVNSFNTVEEAADWLGGDMIQYASRPSQ